MAKLTLLVITILPLVFPFFVLKAHAENNPKLLKPKSQSVPKPLERPNQPLKTKTLLPAKVQQPVRPSGFESVSYSILVGTPLIHESFYEKRFAALSNLHLFSIPIYRIAPELFLHFETGPGFSFARLTFENPPLQYSHIFILVPAHFRLIYTVRETFHLEVFAGAMLRPIEYDSRTTTDGGTRWLKGSSLFQGDVGLGLNYNLNPAIKLRMQLGYQFLAGGLELNG